MQISKILLSVQPIRMLEFTFNLFKGNEYTFQGRQLSQIFFVSFFIRGLL